MATEMTLRPIQTKRVHQECARLWGMWKGGAKAELLQNQFLSCLSPGIVDHLHRRIRTAEVRMMGAGKRPIGLMRHRTAVLVQGQAQHLPPCTGQKVWHGLNVRRILSLGLVSARGFPFR